MTDALEFNKSDWTDRVMSERQHKPKDAVKSQLKVQAMGISAMCVSSIDKSYVRM
jgi:hypothetical protein